MTPEQIEALFSRDAGDLRRRALATLIRLLGDFDLAEEVLHDAIAIAIAVWAREGEPRNPSAWLVSTGRRKAIDRLRRARRFDALEARGLLDPMPPETSGPSPNGQFEAPTPDHPDATTADAWPDDRLRLIFTCCHPALALEARVALTLRTVGGLGSDEIARAFVLPVATLQQRLVRAKAKIRDAGIPYREPEAHELAERLDGVLAVLYLIFNEGYSPSAGQEVTDINLCAEAIRLTRLLTELGTGSEFREARGLLALLLLQDSRRAARVSSDGEIVLLEDQDRALWNQDQIAEGLPLVDRVLGEGPAGSYAIQAAIAALHARARTPAATDWRQIAALYTLLAHRAPSPIVELNRAAAIAMAGDLDRGLLLLEALRAGGSLRGYHLLEAARADLLRRLDRRQEAADAYRAALSLARLAPERRFLERRLLEVTGESG